MGVRHTFIRGANAPRIPLEAADQRSGARGAGRRIHRCWPASRGCQPAACGRHRLWNVTVGSVGAGMSHSAHPVRSLVDPTIEADLLAAGGVASSAFFAPVGCVHARESRYEKQSLEAQVAPSTERPTNASGGIWQAHTARERGRFRPVPLVLPWLPPRAEDEHHLKRLQAKESNCCMS